MTITAENILFLGSIMLLASILISKMGSKFGVPVLLLFLVAGMLFGVDGVGIKYDDVEGVQFIGMIALSIILFQGGMDTKFKEIRKIMWHGITLSTFGVLLTTIFTGLFIYFISKPLGVESVTAPLAMLLAATMSSTDSASVFNILRGSNIGLRKHAQPMLELESGSNDPMAYMLTIALIQIVNGAGNVSAWSVVYNIIIQLFLGTVLGVTSGLISIKFINRINLKNDALYPIVLICLIFMIFTITTICNGNGYLAVYIAGLLLGNKPLVKKRECVKFLEGIVWFLQIVMFVMLGLLVNPHEMLRIAPFALLIALFMMFVGRPLSVFLTLLPFKKPFFKARLFISWVGLRGATPIIFATYPVVENVPGADIIFNIVFFVTMLSLLLQGTTIKLAARKLDMIRILPKEGNEFGVELPEEMDSDIWDMELNENMLKNGKHLKDITLPKDLLVIMVKRGDEYIVPNGSLELLAKDKLLFISKNNVEKEKVLQE